ncbi:MAG: twin-arginine translocase subunit TatC [Anaerolineales bacterium]|jgi:sec-independent protein translocase protein TatC
MGLRDTLRRILTAPFRWIAWPFKKIRDFINHEARETSLSEILAQSVEKPSDLLEHLVALRGLLIRSVIALLITTTVSFTFAPRILEFLSKPIGGTDTLQAIEVTESVGAFMRVSLLSGLVLAFPYIWIEFFAFIHPGLKRRERVFVLVAMPFAALLFLTGLAFAYYIMLPAALDFLLDFMDITTVPRPSNYIRFVTGIMFWIGVSFQYPLIIYTLAAIGLVRPRMLLEGWRIAVVAIAVLAAAVTPTVDPVNMALVMAPMVVLYLLGILLAAVAEHRHKRPT